MALCEINDVDVVADGSAIFRVVVYPPVSSAESQMCVQGLLTITKHEQLLTLSNCDLSQQGQQVEGDTLRILSHDATGVSACRVEVAQQSTVPLGTRLALLLCVVALSLDVSADQLLYGILGVSVRVCGAQRAGLGDGDHALEACGIAVDGSG